MFRNTWAVAGVLAVAAVAGCGGGTSGPGGGGASGQLQVGGTYQVTPTVLQSVCGTVTVEPGPATVAHSPGASDFRLTHVGQTYAGRVERNGSFVTDPLVISLGQGSTDTVRLEGRFRTDGLEATVTVDTNHAGAAPCRYVVGWQAAKQGSPNVIPG
jgi:hypothetical protein